MFDIKKYLQYKNTPDGKPRIIIEKEDFWIKTSKGLYIAPVGAFDEDWKDIVLLSDEWDLVANLSDCRPLLTVEIDGVEWAEGDIAVTDGNLKIVYMVEENSVYKMVGRLANQLWDDNNEGFIYNSQKLGSFFDDPAKYSKLLWNCEGKEGWEKIFKLLNIKI
jgi:hypothetical protein